MKQTGIKKIALPEMEALLPWYRENARDLPWRHTRDPYCIWVSEIMLQQTRVEAVIRYYERFLARLPDVAALAACPQEELLKLWEGLGYYSRVRNMQKAAKVIMAQYGGVFPRSFDEIRALPGIGEYTAGAIGAFAFDLPVPAVDGNVMRVVARLCAFDEDVLAPATRRAVTEAVAAALPADQAADFDQAMIELGATVCLPNGIPKCGECPMARHCAAHSKGVEAQLPVRKKAAPRKIQQKTVLILRVGDRVALRRRPSSGLLASLYEPPCLEGVVDLQTLVALLKDLGLTPIRVIPLEASKHIFTHIEWEMTGFEVALPEEACRILANIPDNGVEYPFHHVIWAPREEIDGKYAVPTAYRAYRPYM